MENTTTSVEPHLVSKMLDDEGAVGHARLLEEGAGFQMGVVQFLGPGIIGTSWHLGNKEEKKEKPV